MGIAPLLLGLLVGFVIATPVGPIGLLCIHRTLAHGRRSGIMTGLGAAVADVFYGAIAVLGLTFIAEPLASLEFWLRLGAAALLGFLGVRTFLHAPTLTRSVPTSTRMAGYFLSALILTVTNPMTLISFVFILAGLNIPTHVSGAAKGAEFLSGVFLGSNVWWLALTMTMALLRHKFTINGLRWINIAAGVVLFASGILLLLISIPGPFNRLKNGG